MSEKQEDLIAPEHREEQLHTCPVCEREFRNLEDFPRIHIASVSIKASRDISSKLPHWEYEALSKEDIIPGEVAAYFLENPSVDELVHEDGYIYERPYFEKSAYREALEKFPERYANARIVGGNEYKKKLNWSPAIKSLITQSESMRDYFQALKSLEGREVRTKDIFPKWRRYQMPGIIIRDMGFIVPEDDRLQVYLSEPHYDDKNNEESKKKQQDYEEQKNKNGNWVAEIGIWIQGPNYGSGGGPSVQRVTSIGQIEYQGRINSV